MPHSLHAVRLTCLLVASLACAARAVAGDTYLVSVNADGVQGDAGATVASLSADGRWVAFESAATNLTPGITNPGHIFVRDLLTGSLVLASRATSGAKGNASSERPYLSGDGRYVVFQSLATNLVAGDLNDCQDIFVRDLVLGTTVRASIASDGSEPEDNSNRPTISDDGRYVSFYTPATLGFANDTNSSSDVFVRDLQLGITHLVSVTPSGFTGISASVDAAIAGNGRYVAFLSHAKDILPGQTNNSWQVYRRDLLAQITERASVSPAGAPASAGCDEIGVSVDGNTIVFVTAASNLVPGDTSTTEDAYARDMALGITERVSRTPTGAEPSLSASMEMSARSVSGDGRYVTYASSANDILPGVSNGKTHVYLYDRATGTTTHASVTWQGGVSSGFSDHGQVSDDGKRVLFACGATDMAPIESNVNLWDLYVRDSGAGAWLDLGSALAGTAGEPDLAGAGPLVPGTGAAMVLTQARPTSLAMLLVALTPQPTPFKQGLLVAVPPALTVALTTDASGQATLKGIWPPGIPAGLQFAVQVVIPDPVAVLGFALSNALQGSAP